MLALLALLSSPALARLGAEGSPIEELPPGELFVVLTTLGLAAMRWFMRSTGRRTVVRSADPAPASLAAHLLGSSAAGRSVRVGEERARAQSVRAILSARAPAGEEHGDEDIPGAAEAVARWSSEFSEPLFLDLVATLHAELLRRRVDGAFGPFEGLLRPGAREALLHLAGVTEVHGVLCGPARLCGHSVGPDWLVLDVELYSVVDETWQGGPRRRLRRDRLRLQRATAMGEVPAPAALARVQEAAGDDLVLPAELGGWVLAQLVATEVLPLALPTLRRVCGPEAGSAGRPARVPQRDLEERLAGLHARHPDLDPTELHLLLVDLATTSLAVRSRQAEDPGPAFTGTARRLHAFWRAAQQAVEPPAEFDRADFVPAHCRVEGTRPLAVLLDPSLELLHFGVTIAADPPPGVGPEVRGHSHEEVWVLGRALDGTGPLQVLDIEWAPQPLPTR